MARAYFRRRLMREVLGVFVKNRVASQKKRRLQRSVRKVSRMFRLKVLLRAWQKIRQMDRLKHAIAPKTRKPLKYCIKYSE